MSKPDVTFPAWDAGREIVLDPGSPEPLYFQVSRQLHAAIQDGRLPAGARLGNEVDLAARLRLSRPTLRQAIQTLVNQGLLVRRRGVGTQVVRTKVARPLRLSSLFDDLAGLGAKPESAVLVNRVEEAGAEVAELLEAPGLTHVRRLKRLRSTEGEPLALMNNYLPDGVLDPGDDELRERGLYQLLRSAGVRLHAAEQNIGARLATEEDAELLQEEPGAALLTMQRTTYDDAGRVVEYGWHVYRASRYTFNLSLTNGPQ
ncbi:GntR family transcriptional regulator [Amycolatopsis mediterranei S699]|uniref:GntR family transcriptional regulator n=2 Tax=Amycolatopsis mediterranei TaxID=33910 RepID=A0A0H3D1P0_AMYMU|nr:GntR family transcriptional regulator [Amycolatopsis mediterranei]ADJ44839.1 GntR family transcriptional regulator [Amycolatopsis mediterranei U32]AEK41587.1 GntR family transcriptional regulator [Amycolatopsis mediterranei S699]AFO76550.1 GntR family transcriptional regulator [Amycolatopsis mediterranei S699]AGT83679.1 GntR family transcriptional regulator [Amycolatopsis mediterranei RB]KDO07335.1 GntR family transcriptional regulator [Amycolatopsis mediterranei]